MKWKRIISFTLALSLVIGTVSGLPPLKTTKKAEAKGSYWNKAYNWGTKNEFVDMINSKYKKTYGTTFHKNGGHVFRGANGYKVDLTEEINFPDGTGEKTYRYWWFVTLDKYHTPHSSSIGTTHKVISNPKNGISQNNVWSTTYLRAKPEKSKNYSAKGGYFFDYIELGGGKDKFKEDLGRTVNGMGVSMYVVDLKQWMADKKSNGYTKWKYKYNAKKNGNTIVKMYFNGVVKTSESGKGENSYKHKNLQSFSDWWKYTVGFAFHTESRKGEYYQHYNIPVEFDFVSTTKDYKTNVIVESRLSQDSNKYAKTYTNQDFAWSKNISDIQKRNYDSVYSELKTAEGKKNDDDEGQFYPNSGFKIDKSLIKALTKDGDLVLRGVRLERYAVDKTSSNKNKYSIIPKSFTKKQTEKLKDKYFDYGDVAHVYLTGSVEELRKMYANPDSVTTTNHSVGDRNLAKASPAKNTFATKVKKVNVSDKGKFYTLNGKYNAKKTGKNSYTFTTKGNGSKDAKKNYKWASKDLGKAITYNQFLDYVCNLKFQVNPFEKYGTGKDAAYRKYENHLVFIFERAAEPNLTLDVERVSFNSKTGKYTSDGVEEYDVDTIHCSEGQDPIKEPVTLNVGATAKEALTGKLPVNKATGQASTLVQNQLEGWSKQLFYYKDSDPVPYILGGYVVDYIDKNNQEKSKTITAGGADTINYEGTDYPIWDGSNGKISSLLGNVDSKLWKSSLDGVDLRQKCTIHCIYVKPKTLATQINYIKDKKSSDYNKAIITQNEQDVYSQGIKDNEGKKSFEDIRQKVCFVFIKDSVLINISQ